MPIFKTELSKGNIQIEFWHITENETELIRGLELSAQALARLNARVNVDHRKEYLAVRQLLKYLKISPELQQYNEFGAPYLINDQYLSISHSKGYVAVAIAQKPIGIDIEKCQEKILRIMPRFLNASENFFNPLDIAMATQIWTSKEAIYKALQIPGMQLQNIVINPFKTEDKNGTAEVKNQGSKTEFSLEFVRFEDHCASIAMFK